MFLRLTRLSSSRTGRGYTREQGGRSSQDIVLAQFLRRPFATAKPARLHIPPSFAIVILQRNRIVREPALQRVGGLRMVLLQLGHEAAVGAHERAICADCIERLAR